MERDVCLRELGAELGVLGRDEVVVSNYDAIHLLHIEGIAALKRGDENVLVLPKMGKGIRRNHSRDGWPLRAGAAIHATADCYSPPTRWPRKSSRRPNPKCCVALIANWTGSPGPVIYVEGLSASDGSRITAEDNALFNWAAGHKILEWGDNKHASEDVH
jgi:hypothetical protein